MAQRAGQRRSVTAQGISHRGPPQANPPGHVERDEGDPHPGCENAIRRHGVDVEVELGGRGHVARRLDRAAHDDQPPDPPHRTFVRVERLRDVGQRPEGDNGERLAALARNRVSV